MGRSGRFTDQSSLSKKIKAVPPIAIIRESQRPIVMSIPSLMRIKDERATTYGS